MLNQESHDSIPNEQENAFLQSIIFFPVKYQTGIPAFYNGRQNNKRRDIYGIRQSWKVMNNILTSPLLDYGAVCEQYYLDAFVRGKRDSQPEAIKKGLDAIRRRFVNGAEYSAVREWNRYRNATRENMDSFSTADIRNMNMVYVMAEASLAGIVVNTTGEPDKVSAKELSLEIDDLGSRITNMDAFKEGTDMASGTGLFRNGDFTYWYSMNGGSFPMLVDELSGYILKYGTGNMTVDFMYARADGQYVTKENENTAVIHRQWPSRPCIMERETAAVLRFS